MFYLAMSMFVDTGIKSGVKGQARGNWVVVLKCQVFRVFFAATERL